MSDRFNIRYFNKNTRKFEHYKIGTVNTNPFTDCTIYEQGQLCTGLKDKNGKLIYEGDILQSEEYPFKNEKGYNYAAEVLWDDASATFYYYTFKISNNVAGRSTGNTGELNEYEDWKVIGNIYKNKELLNEVDE